MRRAGLFCAVLALVTLGADWARYRGPDGSGVADRAGPLPLTWSDTQNVAWRTALPGFGTSSPIVWGDRVFLTAYSGYGTNEADPGDINRLERHVLGVQLQTGAILWDRKIPAAQPEQPYEGFMALHGYASNTPVTDGQRVYVFLGRGGVRAYDLEGHELWTASVGEGLDGWGSASSPLLVGNLLIVNASVESEALVALDKATGREAWRASPIRRCWGSPILATSPRGPELVVSMEGQVLGFDPQTGKERWRCEGVDDYVCPSPVTDDGVVYVIGGRQGLAMAIRTGGQGDVSNSHVIWRTNEGSNVSSPLLLDGHLYWVSDAGIAYCLKASNGDVVYKERLARDRVYASIVAADRKLFAVTRQDGTYVLPAEPRFEVLAHNTFEEDKSVFNASPAPVGSKLLLRSDRFLYSLGLPGR